MAKFGLLAAIYGVVLATPTTLEAQTKNSKGLEIRGAPFEC